MRFYPIVAATLLLAACGGSTPVSLAAPPMPFGTEMPANSSAITGGCRAVSAFTTSAVPELQKDGCLGCHAGPSHPAATNALDLTNVGKDDSIACARALAKVNLKDKPASAILIAPTGGQPHAGGKVQDARAFKTAMLGWIDSE